MRARGFAVSGDAVLVALVCALAWGCAARTPAAQRPHDAGGAIYDAVDEWQRDRPAVVFAPRPVRLRAPILMGDDAAEVDMPELRSALAYEAARIQAVQPIVGAVARAREVPPDLINGIIWVESRFQLRARSPKSASGLMQLMPATGREIADALGLRYNPYDPHFNIDAGTYYLVQMVERFAGNLRLALAAYNIGPAVVDGWLRHGEAVPARSQQYVDNVLGAARLFRARSAPPSLKPQLLTRQE